MEQNKHSQSPLSASSTPTPRIDIRSSSTKNSSAARHSPKSKKMFIYASILLIVLAGILIALRIKAHRDYLKTPLGELEALSKQSDPVNKTLEERENQMSVMSDTSVAPESSREEREKMLEAMNQ